MSDKTIGEERQELEDAIEAAPENVKTHIRVLRADLQLTAAKLRKLESQFEEYQRRQAAPPRFERPEEILLRCSISDIHAQWAIDKVIVRRELTHFNGHPTSLLATVLQSAQYELIAGYIKQSDKHRRGY